MISAAVCASANRVTAVVPYFGYARQDRKDKPHAVVSAVEETREIIQAGANRLLVLDVHSSAVENTAHAFHIPCDHLFARLSFLDHLRADTDFLSVLADKDLIIAGPDLHAGNLAKKYAQAFGNVPIALAYKTRDLNSGETEILSIVGEVHGKNVLIVDDMIDTAGTLCKAAAAFRGMGAMRIFAVAAHGVFSTDAKTGINARTLIANSVIEKVFTTDSIFQQNLFSKGEAVSVASLLGEAIWRIHTNQSVSALFEE
jgi:ribose-phosphate pyrophosphokinase